MLQAGRPAFQNFEIIEPSLPGYPDPKNRNFVNAAAKERTRHIK
jgi:hypothetical protein